LLVRYRFDQVRRRAAVKMRIAAMLREQRVAEPAVGRWTKGWLAWLGTTTAISEHGRWVVEQHLAELRDIQERVCAVERQLEKATTDDPVVHRLRQITGIGPVTAWTMRAIVGRFDRFATGKQLARFCALTPRNSSSGQRQADAGLIKAGDPSLKCVLIQAAQRLRRHDPRWRGLYERLRNNGKPVCLAIAAVANRWVRSLHHQLTEVRAA
jgi:transposase